MHYATFLRAMMFRFRQQWLLRYAKLDLNSAVKIKQFKADCFENLPLYERFPSFDILCSIVFFLLSALFIFFFSLLVLAAPYLSPLWLIQTLW